MLLVFGQLDTPVQSNTNSTLLGSIQRCGTYCTKIVRSYNCLPPHTHFLHLSELGASTQRCDITGT